MHRLHRHRRPPGQSGGITSMMGIRVVFFAPDSLKLLGLSLNETWSTDSALPLPPEVNSALREWGIYDSTLA